MQLFVKTLTGATATIFASPSDPIAAVSSRLASKLHVPVSAQLLTFAGKPLSALHPHLTLADLGVGADSTLHLSARLLGGGGAKKRRKKAFATPKKGRHEKRHEELAVLRHYAVDEATGAVARRLPECPNAACGAGTFMARHADRLHCGKCGLTFLHGSGERGEAKVAAPDAFLAERETLYDQSRRSIVGPVENEEVL